MELKLTKGAIYEARDSSVLQFISKKIVKGLYQNVVGRGLKNMNQLASNHKVK